MMSDVDGSHRPIAGDARDVVRIAREHHDLIVRQRPDGRTDMRVSNAYARQAVDDGGSDVRGRCIKPVVGDSQPVDGRGGGLHAVPTCFRSHGRRDDRRHLTASPPATDDASQVSDDLPVLGMTFVS